MLGPGLLGYKCPDPPLPHSILPILISTLGYLLGYPKNCREIFGKLGWEEDFQRFDDVGFVDFEGPFEIGEIFGCDIKLVSFIDLFFKKKESWKN